jgi:hypothetical protein
MYLSCILFMNGFFFFNIDMAIYLHVNYIVCRFYEFCLYYIFLNVGYYCCYLFKKRLCNNLLRDVVYGKTRTSCTREKYIMYKTYRNFRFVYSIREEDVLYSCVCLNAFYIIYYIY